MEAPCGLCELPTEILTCILLVLSLSDLIKARLINRLFDFTIQTTPAIQYAIELEAAGLVDNKRNTSGTVERLDKLRRREQSWLRCERDAVYHSQPIYTGPGAGFMSTEKNCIYFSTQGPRTKITTLPWLLDGEHEIEHKQRLVWSDENILNVFFSVEQNDLLVVLISSLRPNFECFLKFIQFSTGKNHPLSQHAHLAFPDASSISNPFCDLDVLGDLVVLVINQALLSKLHVISWKTGRTLLVTSFENSGSYGATFLSEKFLLIMKSPERRLDIWELHLESNGTSNARPLSSLGLPGLRADAIYWVIEARYNASVRNRRVFNRPFYSSPEKALLLLDVGVRNIGSSYVFTLVCHRQAIIAAARQATIDCVPWAEWGPRTSHMFYRQNSSAVASCGQRIVYSDVVGMTVIRDFNPYLIRRLLRDSQLPKQVTTISRPTSLTSTLFDEPIHSGLPYVETVIPTRNVYDELWIDERKVIGLLPTSISVNGRSFRGSDRFFFS